MYRLVLFTLTLCNTTICMQSKKAPQTIIETCYLVILNDMDEEQVEVYIEEPNNGSKYRHKSLNFTNEITSSHVHNTEKKDKRLEIVKNVANWRIVIHKYINDSLPPKMIDVSSLYKEEGSD